MPGAFLFSLRHPAHLPGPTGFAGCPVAASSHAVFSSRQIPGLEVVIALGIIADIVSLLVIAAFLLIWFVPGGLARHFYLKRHDAEH